MGVRSKAFAACGSLGGRSFSHRVPLAFAAGRILRQQRYGVEPHDWQTMAIVGMLMGMVAVAAALLPAIRATRIDPAGTLRHEAAG